MRLQNKQRLGKKTSQQVQLRQLHVPISQGPDSEAPTIELVLDCARRHPSPGVHLLIFNQSEIGLKVFSLLESLLVLLQAWIRQPV
mmetsp:Transcript_143229/g.252823  ORF Transcript_143229/g.252823 Transcript_143229/m.252823 type:complete len:86 (-) Transcript_143229:15-272(-)